MDNNNNLKHVLIICEKINEVNRIRKSFNNKYVIKATSAVQDGAYTAKSFNADLVIYSIGSDYKHLFKLYKELREDGLTSRVPLIVIVDLNSLKFLTDTVDMFYTNIVGATISSENLFALAESLIK